MVIYYTTRNCMTSTLSFAFSHSDDSNLRNYRSEDRNLRNYNHGETTSGLSRLNSMLAVSSIPSCFLRIHDENKSNFRIQWNFF